MVTERFLSALKLLKGRSSRWLSHSLLSALASVLTALLVYTAFAK